jgi:D-alanyl-D-alanine carboxypeptidase/D-alanyl-D-alanine-endopeptidase (penicillin-binding protein 4)
MSRRRTQLWLGKQRLLVIALLQLLACAFVSVAQNAPSQPSNQSRTPGDVPKDQAADVSATTGTEPRTLRGLQGVLVETMDGRVVASQSVDQQFNPASTVKLATALVALRTLGPQHRFATGVWTDGQFDKANGIVNGNLYISGRDPSFHYEHAVLIARQLNLLGIRQVTGDLVVAPGFTMNFNWSARVSGEQLRDTLDSTRRYAEAVRAWEYERTLLADHANGQTTPTLVVTGAVTVGPVATEAKLLFTQNSSKLVEILKVLLCYSNNFMAERIGDALGGPDSISRQVSSYLGIGPGEIRLSSASGLGINRISPRVMMKIYRALLKELKQNNLSPSDIMPVAGIDPGTLQQRFTGMAWRGSVIAKTGTLVRTDGGASSLVGQLKTANGEVLLFVIMNQRGNVIRFRENQDYLVMLVQNTRGGPKAFTYRPVTLAMRLSDTETIAASEEYEPKSSP